MRSLELRLRELLWDRARYQVRDESPLAGDLWSSVGKSTRHQVATRIQYQPVRRAANQSLWERVHLP